MKIFFVFIALFSITSYADPKTVPVSADYPIVVMCTIPGNTIGLVGNYVVTKNDTAYLVRKNPISKKIVDETKLDYGSCRIEPNYSLVM